MASFHVLECSRRCRVCARIVQQRPSPRPADRFPEELLLAFGIDLRLDEFGWASTTLCSRCVKIAQRLHTETKSGSPREFGFSPIREWPQSCGEACELCSQWSEEGKGGRKKKTIKRGRPSGAVPEDDDAPDPKKRSLEDEGPSYSSSSQLMTGSSAGLQKFAADLELSTDHFQTDLQVDVFVCPICRNVLD